MQAAVLALLAVATVYADRAEMVTRDGHVVTEADGFKLTSMDGMAVLDVTNTSISLDANTVSITASDKLTIATDDFTAMGSSASIKTGATAVTVTGATVTMAAGTNTAITANVAVDLEATSASLSSDALSLKGDRVTVAGTQDVTLDAGTFSVLNADDSARVTVTSTTANVAVDTVTITGQSAADIMTAKDLTLTTGTGGSSLGVDTDGIAFDADSIVLVGKDGSFDLDAMFEDLEALISDAESLDVELTSVDKALRDRAQGQTDQVTALDTQRDTLSSGLSTEASEATAELIDLDTDVQSLDTDLTSALAQDGTSVETRQATAKVAIDAMPAKIAAVSAAVATHDAALEAAGDALEAKITTNLGTAASSEAVLSGQVSQAMSTLESTLTDANTKAAGHVATAETAEASLNSRFLAAQADVTNKVNGVNALKTQLTGQISTAESKIVAAVATGRAANAVIDTASELVTDLSKMVKNNDQNVVVAISRTLSGSKKTVDRAKVLLAEVEDGNVLTRYKPSVVTSSDYYAKACDRVGGLFSCGSYLYGLYGGVFTHTVNPTTGVVTPKQTIIPSGSVWGNAYFGYAVRADGDYLIVGSPLDYSSTTTGTSSYRWGRAFIYKKDSKDIYSLQRRVVPLLSLTYGPSTSTAIRCGYSVAIKGTVAVMGCPYYGARSSSFGRYYQGALFVYNVLTGARTAGPLFPTQHNSLSWDRYQYFGIQPTSIQILDSKTIVAGNPRYDRRFSSTSSTFYSFAGSTFIYSQASNGAWGTARVEPAHLTSSSQQCGYAVTVINSLTLAVGCPGYLNYGAVQILTRTSTTSTSWTRGQLIPRPKLTTGDFFGSSLAASDDGKRLMVGAQNADPKGINNGAAFFFTRGTNGLFTQDAGTAGEFSDPTPSRSNYNYLGLSDIGFGPGTNPYRWYGVYQDVSLSYAGNFLVSIDSVLFPTVK